MIKTEKGEKREQLCGGNDHLRQCAERVQSAAGRLALTPQRLLEAIVSTVLDYSGTGGADVL